MINEVDFSVIILKHGVVAGAGPLLKAEGIPQGRPSAPAHVNSVIINIRTCDFI